MNTELLVSIYIPTHNRRYKLERAVNSVLKQTYQNFELIICDDCSQDETIDYVSSLSKIDERIKYIRNTHSMGACFSRNAALNIAKGYFITGLDDDDEFVIDRIETFVCNWNDKYSFITSNFSDLYLNGAMNLHYNSKKRIFSISDLLIFNEASNQIFTKTDRLKKIGGFDVSVKRLQDWDAWIRMSSEFGDFYRIDKSLYIMNHDHMINESRVSLNQTLDIALEELINRNKKIYNEVSFSIMSRVIKKLRGNYTVIDSFNDSIDKKSIKPVISFLFSTLKKLSLIEKDIS